jgi:hypoxanthine phosphoribosyltransferase
MPQTIKIKDRTFEKFITYDVILKRICTLAEEITVQYEDKNPLFIAILNGSFYFASDLFKELDFPFEITFVKLSSYVKDTSSGVTESLLGLSEDLSDRHILIVEDIIDTGLTMHNMLDKIGKERPASIAVVSLIVKPKSMMYPIHANYVGFEAGNEFLVGYGLDYDKAGRNYKHIYKVKE